MPGGTGSIAAQPALAGSRLRSDAEALCAPHTWSQTRRAAGRPLRGACSRMHLIGCFEGIESERSIEWRWADSLSFPYVWSSG